MSTSASKSSGMHAESPPLVLAGDRCVRNAFAGDPLLARPRPAALGLGLGGGASGQADAEDEDAWLFWRGVSDNTLSSSAQMLPLRGFVGNAGLCAPGTLFSDAMISTAIVPPGLGLGGLISRDIIRNWDGPWELWPASHRTGVLNSEAMVSEKGSTGFSARGLVGSMLRLVGSMVRENDRGWRKASSVCHSGPTCMAGMLDQRTSSGIKMVSTPSPEPWSSQ